MHPRYEINKTYQVNIDKPIKESDINQITKGIQLKDGMTSPAKIEVINPKKIEITIHEGKNRIVRRIFNKLEYEVISLKRVKIGNLKLTLKTGQYKDLTEEDKKLILN
jgi:23S rRNA pseudouridine2605 synthase